MSSVISKPLYDAAGPVGAPAILLIHGSVVTRKMWLPQIEMLSDDYRVIAPDLPRHGAQAGLPFRMLSAVQTIYDVLEQEWIEQALVVGMSLGGYVAMDFAYCYPEKVAGLVISGASMNFTGLVGAWTRFAGFLIKRLGEQRMAESSAKSLRRKLPAELAEPVIEAGLHPLGAAESFAELPGKDFRPMLRTVPAPVLILNGGNDRPNRKGERQFAAAAQNGRVEVIYDAGHISNLEQPEAFTGAVRQFAQSIGWQRETSAEAYGTV